jgi:hypothetical protein
MFFEYLLVTCIVNGKTWYNFAQDFLSLKSKPCTGKLSYANSISYFSRKTPNIQK